MTKYYISKKNSDLAIITAEAETEVTLSIYSQELGKLVFKAMSVNTLKRWWKPLTEDEYEQLIFDRQADSRKDAEAEAQAEQEAKDEETRKAFNGKAVEIEAPGAEADTSGLPDEGRKVFEDILVPEQPSYKEIAKALVDGTPAQTMSEITKKLEGLFAALNNIYFGDKLPEPIITVQSTPKAYGHCSTKQIWQNPKDETDVKYEINIGAEYVSREPENVAATLLHEMIHLYCRVEGIKETSQGVRYHNGKFRDEAEARDLEVDYTTADGYYRTIPTPTFCQKLVDANVKLGVAFAREIPAAKAPRAKRTQFEYTCPVCGNTFKMGKQHNLMCGECEEPFEVVEV